MNNISNGGGGPTPGVSQTNPLVAASVGVKPSTVTPNPQDTSSVFPKSTIDKLKVRKNHL